MHNDIKLCQEIAQRERLSRKEAERLLEVKSLELYEKTQKIERTKAEVEGLNDLLMNVMASSPDGIITCSQDLKIQAINATAERQLAYCQEDLIGCDIDKIIPGLNQILSVKQDNAFKLDHLAARRSNGETFVAEIRGSRDGRNEQTFFVLFVHDISKELLAQKELKMRELQIDEARRLEAIGALSAGIAHEINTPIQFIGDNLGFLRDALSQIHEAYENYETLRIASSTTPLLMKQAEAIAVHNHDMKLKNKISDVFEAVAESLDGIEQVRDIVLLMKEFAHPGTGGREFANINYIIEGVVKISHNKYRGLAQVETDLDIYLPEVKCRRGQIQQVILNLVMNAVDAIEETGKTPGIIRLSTTHDSENVYIHVSDTGPGVPEALKEKVFDPFFTTKAVGKGTGQGLALAKDFIITGHEGGLKFIDVNGFSTTFQISLPRRKHQNSKQEQQYAA